MAANNEPGAPNLLWDSGTAYDVFQSLTVLHHPEKFNVRKAWTAGMRARLTPASRETLEMAQHLLQSPLAWVYSLPEPKNAETLLWSLGRVPAAGRIAALSRGHARKHEEADALLRGVADRGTWGEEDLQQLCSLYGCGEKKHAPSIETVRAMLQQWANAEAFGEALLEALRNYVEVFFGEEERRILPALEQSMARAKSLADRLSFSDLLEELSHGLRFDPSLGTKELVLVPSFWITPLMRWDGIDDQRTILLFGARPVDASVVPGETVPDALMLALKGLADPTRLKVLRLLASEPMAAAELAKRLRLRTPTVMHHLRALRLAGLIQITLPSKSKKEKNLYAYRPSAMLEAAEMLKEFLSPEEGGRHGTDANEAADGSTE